ncbi:MAG: BatD family protein [Bacteroidota bacterium]|nr:BatD family protein [Bacteroidota bacterium]
MNRALHSFFTGIFYKSLLLLLFIIPVSSAFGQVKFFAECPDRIIGKNDYLQIQFTVENAGNIENINPPSFKNFTIVSGPNQQSSMSNINGNVKQSVSIGFVLKPLSTGTFSIGSATAKIDGKEYHSNPINIEVNNSPSSNKSKGNFYAPTIGMNLDFPPEPTTHQFDDYILRKGENVPEKIKKNLFIKIDVNKNSCYVGQPIIATYKLYTRLKSESNVLKTPSFNGFSVSELERPNNYSIITEKYNGREYNVYILRKVQLYPLQSGALSLEPIEVENNITFLKAEYAGKKKGDVFYDMLRDFANENSPGGATQSEKVSISCNPVTINVKPLPEENKPTNFKGAVGNFNINATLEKTNISTDDAGNLKLIIAGAGNLQMINSPNVVWPKGLESFESKSSENIDKFSVPMKGEKIFSYPFSVNKPGDYSIPSVSFSYFDIGTQSYKTINTQPLLLHVEKGSGHKNFVIPATQSKKEPFSFNDSLYNNRWYFLAGVVFLSLILVLITGRKKEIKAPVKAKESFKNYEPDPVEEAAFIIPANPLAEAEEKLINNNAVEFYKVLDASLKNYLSEKLKVPGEEMTRKKINARMDKCNVSVGTTLLVSSLLDELEINLYAPVSSEIQMQEVYEKASEVVSLLDKQVC